MAKKQHEEVNTEGWKDTYGDMVTLLLCFFVLLYSMSSVNSEKWEAFVKAFTNPGEDTAQVVLTPSDELGDHTVPGAENGDSPVVDPASEFPTSFDELAQAIKDYVEENNMQQVIEVEGEQGIVYIRFQNSLFFEPNKAVLLPEAIPSLEFLGTSLKNLEDEIWMVSISGHTADVPGSTGGPSEWLLSAERAGQVAIYLEDHAGLDPLLLRAIGFGRNYPIESNDTDEGRARNRRVEMVIISRDSSIAQNDALASAVSGLFEHETAAEDTPLPDDLMDLLDPSRMGEGNPDESSPASSAPEGEEDAGSQSTAASMPEGGEDGPESGQTAASAPPEG